MHWSFVHTLMTLSRPEQVILAELTSSVFCVPLKEPRVLPLHGARSLHLFLYCTVPLNNRGQNCTIFLQWKVAKNVQLAVLNFVYKKLHEKKYKILQNMMFLLATLWQSQTGFPQGSRDGQTGPQLWSLRQDGTASQRPQKRCVSNHG